MFVHSGAMTKAVAEVVKNQIYPTSWVQILLGGLVLALALAGILLGVLYTIVWIVKKFEEGFRLRRLWCGVGLHQLISWSEGCDTLGYKPTKTVTYCLNCKTQIETMHRTGNRWPNVNIINTHIIKKGIWKVY